MRLRELVPRADLKLSAVGPSWLSVQGERFRLDLPAQGPVAVASSAPVFVFGLGLGELLQAPLAAGSQVIAWERDAALLAEALARLDLTTALRRGQLRLLLGADLLDCLPLPAGTHVLAHPMLARIYQAELALLSAGAPAPRALVCQGGLFVEDLGEALRGRGFAVFPMDLVRASLPELDHILRRVAPRLVAAINPTEGLPELCARHQVPLLVWEIDPLVRAGLRPVAPAVSAGTHVFTFRQANVPEFQRAGYQQVEHLPLATNPNRRQPVAVSAEEQRHYGAPIAFIGSSQQPEVAGFAERFRHSHLAHYGPDSGAAADALLATLLSRQREVFERNLIPELLAELRPDWPATALPARYASEIASAERRRRAVVRLGGRGLDVWGDAGWAQGELGGARYRGPAKHRSELNRIYGASAINLDLGRLYQLDIATMRLFDILACGAFVLAEYSAGLESLFALDRELVCYRTLEELEQKVEHFLAHPEQARAIAAAGREAVLARHTIRQRVDVMLSRLA